MEQTFVLILLQKSLAGSALFQLGDRRLTVRERRIFPHSKRETAANDGQFSVNGRIRCSSLTPRLNVAVHLGRPEPGHLDSAEQRLDVSSYPPLYMLQVSAPPKTVVIDHQGAEISNRGPFWTVTPARSNLSNALFEELIGVLLVAKPSGLAYTLATHEILNPPYTISLVKRSTSAPMNRHGSHSIHGISPIQSTDPGRDGQAERDRPAARKGWLAWRSCGVAPKLSARCTQPPLEHPKGGCFCALAQ
jgi:hypothetical protein